MPPVRNYSNWNKRRSDEIEQTEPYRKFFFICEGVNTETWYFQSLIDLRKELGIHPLIDICLLEKTDEDRDVSYPLHLIQFANAQKDNPAIRFDKTHDKMIVVFDADIFESKVANYNEILKIAEQSDDIPAVTNPAFELFLLLHFPNAYRELIAPHLDDILKNEKDGNQTYVYKLLREKSGMNSKKNRRIGEPAKQIDVAIEQERNLNQDVYSAQGRVTSNVAKVICEIRNSAVPL